MNTIDISIHTRDIINPKVAEIMQGRLACVKEDGDFGLGCSIVVDDDDEDDIQLYQDGFIWNVQNRKITQESLHIVDIERQLRFGGPCYAILSNSDLDAEVADIYSDMMSGVDGTETGSLVALQNGFLILTSNPGFSMYQQGVAEGHKQITAEIARNHMRAVVDNDSSGHSRLRFADQATAFIQMMIAQTSTQQNRPDLVEFYQDCSFATHFAD